MIIYTFEATEGLITQGYKDALNEILGKASNGLKVEFVPVGEELSKFLMQFAGVSGMIKTNGKLYFDAVFIEVCQSIELNSNVYKVLITTREGSLLSELCQIENPLAKWGGYRGPVSFVYAPEVHRESTLLHESLHLFDADECYDFKLKPKVSCTNEKCVMRFGVDSREVCDDVIKQLKKYFE